MVMEVSATLVATTTLRTPAGSRSKTRTYNMALNSMLIHGHTQGQTGTSAGSVLASSWDLQQAASYG